MNAISAKAWPPPRETHGGASRRQTTPAVEGSLSLTMAHATQVWMHPPTPLVVEECVTPCRTHLASSTHSRTPRPRRLPRHQAEHSQPEMSPPPEPSQQEPSQQDLQQDLHLGPNHLEGREGESVCREALEYDGRRPQAHLVEAPLEAPELHGSR